MLIQNLPLYNLYQLIFLLEKQGYKYKIKGSVGLSQKNQDIENVRINNQTGEVEILQNLISLTNFNSPLPMNDIENFLFLLKEKNYKLQNFLDIFNHRLAQLFFKAQKNITPKYSEKVENKDKKFLKNMIYTSNKNDIDQVFLVNFCWPSLGSLNDIDRYIRYTLNSYMQNINQTSSFLTKLKQIKEIYFRVSVKNMFGQWINAEGNQIQLGSAYNTSRLNHSNIVGKKILIAFAGVEINIDCFNLNLYNALLPDETLSKQIVMMLKTYCTYSTKIMLNICYYEQDNGMLVENVGLNNLNSLGYNSILGRISMNLSNSKIY